MSVGRVLVTGAAGFIGHACSREFLSRGWDVAAMVHRRQAGNLQGAKLVSGSLTEAQSVEAIFAQHGPFDVVVNCAGLASDVARRRRLMEANFIAVRNLAQCMSRRGGRLVHTSTSDVYGIRDFTDADETTPLEDNLREGYPRSKILAEQAITQTLEASRYVLLRPGAVCGSGDMTILPRVLGFLRKSPFIVHFGRWKGANRWPLAHVRNLAVAAYLAAVREEACGQAYNVVDPVFTTVEAYYRRVLRTFVPEKQNIRSVTIPLAAAWPLSWAGTMLSRLLGRTQPLVEPSVYALHSVASNLDFSSRKLQVMFASAGERFVDSFDVKEL